MGGLHFAMPGQNQSRPLQRQRLLFKLMVNASFLGFGFPTLETLTVTLSEPNRSSAPSAPGCLNMFSSLVGLALLEGRGLGTIQDVDLLWSIENEAISVVEHFLSLAQLVHVV